MSRHHIATWEKYGARDTNVELWVSTYPNKEPAVVLDLDQGVDACADLRMNLTDLGRLIDALQAARTLLVATPRRP